MDKLKSKKYTPLDVEKEARRMLLDFFRDKFPLAIQDWQKLDPVQQWNILIRLLPYVTPKLSAIDVKVGNTSAAQTLIDLVSAQAQK